MMAFPLHPARPIHPHDKRPAFLYSDAAARPGVASGGRGFMHLDSRKAVP